ncbi:hypothetical protein F5146DRAFT_1124907 [Armillaria mellea]|nr:hypothetical protein F5146DRAFT_1124907 [Armillaria mellea]
MQSSVILCALSTISFGDKWMDLWAHANGPWDKVERYILAGAIAGGISTLLVDLTISSLKPSLAHLKVPVATIVTTMRSDTHDLHLCVHLIEPLACSIQDISMGFYVAPLHRSTRI